MNHVAKRIEEFLNLKPIHRFWIGFWFAFVLSILWHFSLWFVLHACPNGTRDFKRVLSNELTYAFVHPLCFSPAFGLLLATIAKPVLDSVTTTGWLVLTLLLVLVSYLAIFDVVDGPVGSYQSINICTAVDTEHTLRTRNDKNDQGFKTDLESFHRSLTPSGYRDAWNLLNWNGIFSGFLTWLFLVFATMFIWYSWVTAFAPKLVITEHLYLILIALLFIPWIPARVYVDWYNSHWHNAAAVNAPIVFGIVIAIMMVAYLAAFGFLAYIRNDVRELALAIIGAIGSSIAVLFSVLPQWVEKANRALETLTPQFVFAIVVVGILLIHALAWRLLEAPNKALDTEPRIERP